VFDENDANYDLYYPLLNDANYDLSFVLYPGAD
jgi:hypothetical protein